MRRKSAPAHENHERWLVSYADFITLLFAFFVVMFASTQNDKKKAAAVSDSVRQALSSGPFSNTLSTVLGLGRHDAKRAPLSKAPTQERENPPLAPPEAHSPDLIPYFAELEKGLAPELQQGKLEVQLLPRGLVVSMREATFFESGAETVSPASIPILARIAAIVRELPNPIRVEGHTDSRPIHNSRFRSNWVLSTARGIAILELMRDRFHVPASRMAVVGYAENAPADTNDTEEGRAHNRRVDLVLLSPDAARNEPAAPGADG
ncbi:MAG: flagellar motor protein MotB, partial [Acidobacteria bacterium]|nr:flagellar motor protein MotB [Acidobacteriota bacterium]